MVFGILAQEGGQAGGSLIGLALPVLMIVGFRLLIRPQRSHSAPSRHCSHRSRSETRS